MEEGEQEEEEEEEEEEKEGRRKREREEKEGRRKREREKEEEGGKGREGEKKKRKEKKRGQPGIEYIWLTIHPHHRSPNQPNPPKNTTTTHPPKTQNHHHHPPTKNQKKRGQPGIDFSPAAGRTRRMQAATVSSRSTVVGGCVASGRGADLCVAAHSRLERRTRRAHGWRRVLNAGSTLRVVPGSGARDAAACLLTFACLRVFKADIRENLG